MGKKKGYGQQKDKHSLKMRIRGWFHRGRFIGFDIQSIIMAVLTTLTIVTTVVMGLLIYNRFTRAIKQACFDKKRGKRWKTNPFMSSAPGWPVPKPPGSSSAAACRSFCTK